MYMYMIHMYMYCVHHINVHVHEHNKQIELTLHGPVIDGCFCYQGDGVETDPLPEGDVFNHLMSLHLTLHFDIEYLETLTSWGGGREGGRGEGGEGEGGNIGEEDPREVRNARFI